MQLWKDPVAFLYNRPTSSPATRVFFFGVQHMYIAAKIVLSNKYIQHIAITSTHPDAHHIQAMHGTLLVNFIA